MAYSIGVDTGGTFTDCVIIDSEGRLTTGKSASTPHDFSIGILDSVRVTAESMGTTMEELLKQSVLFSHGTTVATNAILTRSGAKTGLITTKGFEDTVIMMRSLGRFAGLTEEQVKRVGRSSKPKPIVPKELIRGVPERVDYKGQVIVPLDRERARQAIKDLVDQGVEAIAVALLWGFVNPVHERQIQELIAEMYPQVYVTTASDLVPKLGEYERMATSILNCYLGPATSRYLTSLDKQLNMQGFGYMPLVMQAHGGSLRLESAAKSPVGTIYSGPVAGVAGSRFLGELLGYRNVIATDVGGTSFDVGLIHEGVPEMAHEPTVGQYSLMIPMLDVQSIGAGGGSIAWIEPATNILKVGPKSAGAVPGPVCYDAGGTEPTVTDADLVLGYLNPDYFLGGRIRLNKDKAIEAIRTRIAEPLGRTVVEAAAGIYDIINAHMSDLIRSLTVGRGYDPRSFVLFAYGGAGPVHAVVYGKEAQLIVVPHTASVHSAMGALSSDIIHAHEMSDPMMMPVDVERFNRNFETLANKAIEELRADGFGDEDITLHRYVDMRYSRQVNEVRTPVPLGKLEAEDLENVCRKFEGIYETMYGKGAAYREAGIQVVTFSLNGTGRIRKPSPAKYTAGPADSSAALKGRRDVFFHNPAGFVSTPIYDFDKLQAGNVVIGPAVVETPITTILVNPTQKGRVDEYLNVVIEGKEG